MHISNDSHWQSRSTACARSALSLDRRWRKGLNRDDEGEEARREAGQEVRLKRGRGLTTTCNGAAQANLLSLLCCCMRGPLMWSVRPTRENRGELKAAHAYIGKRQRRKVWVKTARSNKRFDRRPRSEFLNVHLSA
jgi:hypothetical protein